MPGDARFPDPGLPYEPPTVIVSGRSPTIMEAGAGIGWHRDMPRFGDVSGISLLADDGLPGTVVIERRPCRAVGVTVLTPVRILIAARRLAGARPHLAVVAGSCLTRTCGSCAAMSSIGAGVRTGGWDIRRRWYDVVVGPRRGSR